MYGGEGASRNTATFAVSRERRAGPALAIACQQDTVKISCKCGRVMATRRGYGALQRPVALCAWVGQQKQNSAQKHSFANRTTHRFHFHPAHGGELYNLTSMYVW